MFGINGEAYARLRYVWERNSVNNFDQDIMQAYMNPSDQQHRVYDMDGLRQPELQRPPDRRFARRQVVGGRGRLCLIKLRALFMGESAEGAKPV